MRRCEASEWRKVRCAGVSCRGPQSWHWFGDGTHKHLNFRWRQQACQLLYIYYSTMKWKLMQAKYIYKCIYWPLWKLRNSSLGVNAGEAPRKTWSNVGTAPPSAPGHTLVSRINSTLHYLCYLWLGVGLLQSQRVSTLFNSQYWVLQWQHWLKGQKTVKMKKIAPSRQ